MNPAEPQAVEAEVPIEPQGDRRTLAGTRLTAQQRRKRASLGGNTLLQLFGLEYYASLGRLSARARRRRLGISE